MHYGPSASFADPERGHQQASVVRVPRAGASLPGVKRVTRLVRLEYQQTCVIFSRRQGAKRHRDKKVVPTPRQVVTRDIGTLPIADIAVQHRAGNHWQWHRKKSNRSATVRIEEGAAKRAA